MASTNKAPKIDINKLPPFFLQMFPQAKQILTTDPMPGREAEHAAAIKVIQDFLNTDFQKPIDLENVCGHKAPGVVMKEGYCPACYKKENIDECLQYMELCEKYGPERASEMMKEAAMAKASTSGTSSSSQGSSSSQKKN
ncbi:hypothetical protein B9Z55_023927 [Caenorhabditis nigoni]|uniref:Uncharacterized protein n=1 Tax=Caenorhabditis nigoni TaxID=1611254 RepID=A0A2G5SRT0_9PELO|nr:hypothetical protein B9Z55_023927 [Caenorhabditis nigoni]